MSDHPPFLIYGSYGYTGQLTVRHAVERGLKPLLSGRDAAKVAAQAASFDLQARPFSLDDPAAAAQALSGISAVLHCAGPFSATARPMLDACLQTGAHYLDITGEIAVFEALAARDGEALAAGITVLPGAGFDVVPSDCLAAYLKSRLPTARRLELAIRGLGGISQGTALTAVESLGQPSLVRRDGRIVPIPAGSHRRMVDFGRGPVEVVSVSWGDVSTAYYTTGIPNIEDFMPFSGWLRQIMPFTSWLKPAPLRKLLAAAVRRFVQPPDDAQRERGLGLVWGQVTDAAGRQATARLRTPEPYTLTAMTALAAVERVISGRCPPGFQTPARALGADFILEFPGCERTDLTTPQNQ